MSHPRDVSPGDVPVVAWDNEDALLLAIQSYGCKDCDLREATGAWPDAWVGIEEAAEHREATGHRVYLVASNQAPAGASP